MIIMTSATSRPCWSRIEVAVADGGDRHDAPKDDAAAGRSGASRQGDPGCGPDRRRVGEGRMVGFYLGKTVKVVQCSESRPGDARSSTGHSCTRIPPARSGRERQDPHRLRRLTKVPYCEQAELVGLPC